MFNEISKVIRILASYYIFLYSDVFEVEQPVDYWLDNILDEAEANDLRPIVKKRLSAKCTQYHLMNVLSFFPATATYDKSYSYYLSIAKLFITKYHSKVHEATIVTVVSILAFFLLFIFLLTF